LASKIGELFSSLSSDHWRIILSKHLKIVDDVLLLILII